MPVPCGCIEIPACVMLFCWCFMALQHFSGSFGRGQLTYPHCSWASLLGSLPVLSAHSFTSNWQLPFLNQWKGENGHRNYFLTNLYESMLPDVRIEPATVHIPGGCASDRATTPGTSMCDTTNQMIMVILYHLSVKWSLLCWFFAGMEMKL